MELDLFKGTQQQKTKKVRSTMEYINAPPPKRPLAKASDVQDNPII